MMKLSRSVASILLTVVFLVLAAIATVIYSGDQEKQAEMEHNFFYRQTRAALDTVWAVVWSLGNINDQASSTEIVEGNVEANSELGFWSRFGDKIKGEWESGEAMTADVGAGINEMGLINQTDFDFSNFDVPDQHFLSWEKMEKGGEIVFRTKSGQEYRLPLPFKFLNKQTE